MSRRADPRHKPAMALNPYLGLSPGERRNFLGFRRTPKPKIEQYYPPKGHLTRTAKVVDRHAGYRIVKVAPGVFTSDFDPGTELESAAQWRRLIDSYQKPRKRSRASATWRPAGSPQYR